MCLEATMLEKRPIDFDWLSHDVFEQFNEELKSFKYRFEESINATIASQADFYNNLYDKGISIQFWLTEDEVLCEEKVTFDDLFDSYIDTYRYDKDGIETAEKIIEQLSLQTKKLLDYIEEAKNATI